jgi:ATP synthase protein I
MTLPEHKSEQPPALSQDLFGYLGRVSEAPLDLSDEVKRQIDGRARRDLIRVICSQALVGCIVVGLSAAIGGYGAGLSALAGFASYFLPNTLFALRLLLGTYSAKGTDFFVFFVGEFAKVLSALVLLFLVGRFGGDQVKWLYVVIALIATLKSYFITICVEGIKR